MDITGNALNGELIEVAIGERVIPVAVGFGRDGRPQTLRDLRQRTLADPAVCDHTGATWSPNLVTRCGLCGRKMFLPPRLLSYLPASTLTAMEALWQTAGWPEWDQRARAWRLNGHWELRQHPLFDHCLGIPVREDRQDEFAHMVEELAR